MTLLYLVAAWAAGILLAASSRILAIDWLALAVLAVGLAILVRHRRPARVTSLCLALLLMGMARQAWAQRPAGPDHIAHYVDSGYVTLTGLVVRDPDARDNLVNLHVEAESLRRSRQDRPVRGLVLVQAPRYGDYRYGDRIRVSGALLTPPEFDDFSYRDYLARRGVLALIPNAEVETLARDQGHPWTALLSRVKARAQHAIDAMLPSPEAPLLSGILLGTDSALSPDVRDAFNRTGTSHIIAISGANIIVVLRVLLGLLTPGLGRRRASLCAVAGIALYTVFVGAGPAVVRAAIMGSLALLAAQGGRRAHGLTSLAFAIWLMSLWNPFVLWDIGFQLSAAATAGLVLFGDDLTALLRGLLRRGFTETTARRLTHWLAEPLTVSVAAQITTTPLILLYFGRLSVISLAANLLIVPVQPYIMTLGGLAVLAGLIWLPIGEILGWVVWLPLAYTLAVVRRLAHFDWASLSVMLSSTHAGIVYAALLGIAWLRIQHPDDRAAWFRTLRRHVTTTAVLAASAVLLILIWLVALQQPDQKLHVWFLDVGQGHAVLIQTPHGAQILVDGGPNPTRLRRALGDALPFWDRSLDLLIVTQPQKSAIGALPALLDRYSTAAVLTNGQPAQSDDYAALVRAWDQQRAEVVPVTAGYRIETEDGVTLEVLHPQAPPPPQAEPEAVGMVLRVTYGSTSFLLAPELNAEAEQAMLAAGWYAGSTVLELPDHGSEAANSEEFLRAVHPQAAVTLVEAGNRAGLPAPAIAAQVADLTGHPLYRTDQDGTVEMVTDGQKLWIYTED